MRAKNRKGEDTMWFLELIIIASAIVIAMVFAVVGISFLVATIVKRKKKRGGVTKAEDIDRYLVNKIMLTSVPPQTQYQCPKCNQVLYWKGHNKEIGEKPDICPNCKVGLKYE